MPSEEEQEKKLNLDEWLAEERDRLDRGFQFEPKSTTAEPGASADIEGTLAGAGLGAGVVAGAAAPHPDPVTFQGVKPTLIIDALREELTDRDTQIQVNQGQEAMEVTVLQAQEHSPHEFLPALTATLIDTDNALTISVSDLNQRTVRHTLSSMGNTVLREGTSVLVRRKHRGPEGLVDVAGNIIQGIENIVEDIQDLTLRARVWKVIDRVGHAAEQAYLDEQAKLTARQRAHEAARRAWTHCPYCGRAYGKDETDLTQCPSCGGTRGEKPEPLS